MVPRFSVDKMCAALPRRNFEARPLCHPPEDFTLPKPYQVGATLLVDYGRLSNRDPDYGLPVDCYVCGKVHMARDVARVRENRPSRRPFVPICEPCRAKGDPNEIMQKAMSKQIPAMADKLKKGRDGALTGSS
jgi:hypothetical protein